MLEAEFARRDLPPPTWRLSAAYRVLLETLLSLLPAGAIAYLHFSVGADLHFVHYAAHAGYVILVVLLCGTSAYVAWRCHIRTGEPFWRQMTYGLLAGAAVMALSALLPGSPLIFPTRALEVLVAAACLAGIFALRGRPAGPRRATLLTIAMAFLAQAISASILASPWSHQWWLAHAIAITGLLILSYGLMDSFLTTDSLAHAGRPEEMAAAREPDAALNGQVEAAETARQQFESLFAAIPDAALVIGEDGCILKANERTQRLFGYSDEEFAKLSIEATMPTAFDGDRGGNLTTWQDRICPSAKDCDRVILGRSRDGNTFLAKITLAPLRFDQRPCTVAIVRDITETERVAEKVQQSEQRFRDIFDHAPIGMALTSLDGHLFEVNESLCDLLGYNRADLLSKSLQEITYPDDLSGDSALFDQLFDGNAGAVRVEKRFVHKNGMSVWVLLTASLQLDTNGDPLHVLSQIVDIGAIKAARDALAESERQLQRVLDGSNDGFWDRHIPSGVTAFSPRWAAMLGYGSDEIAPTVTTWENLVHPEDLPLCRRLLAQHLSGQRDRYEAVYRMRHRGGHWVWILARGKAYEWDDAGNPVRMAGTHTDVTVRQLTMDALRMREQTLKAVLEALPVGIWIASADGRITSANAAALAMGPGVRYRALAQSEEGQEDWGADGRKVAPHDWALARAIERREKIPEQLVEIEFADGSKKTVLNAGMPILDEQGCPLGAIAVNQDMTNWLKLEQDLLRRSQQLEESNRELEQFAYVASHDLQEPLRKVSSFAQLFAKKYSDRLDQTGQTYIDFMVDGASRMQTLVDDLLHYSRLTRGDRSLHEVDMNRVTLGVLTDLQLTVREAGADVRIGPLPSILGDAGQLRALLQNLVSNAVKYRAKDRSPVVEIGASVQAGEATFWVRDNGIGIHPRYFERIFVIFQRLHARSEYPGTGIGLAICKKIVDNHGGRIWVESATDQGATFFFTLPTGDIKI